VYMYLTFLYHHHTCPVHCRDANTEDAARKRQKQLEFLLEDFSHPKSMGEASAADEAPTLHVMYGSAKSGAGISELREWLAE
jgi:hypothetical protein